MFQEGIPLTPDVVDQPAFVMQDNRLATLREIISAAQIEKEARKEEKFDKKQYKEAEEAFRDKFQPQNIYKLLRDDPETVRRLVIARLQFQAERDLTVSLDGNAYPAQEILNDVLQGTGRGEAAVLLEATRTGVYLELLWEAAIIRPGAANRLQLPE